MRRIGFVLMVLLVGLSSCTLEELEDDYLFAELGLEQLIINDEVMDLNSLGMPYGMSENVVLDGFYSGVTRMDYSLSMLYDSGEDVYIDVVSSHYDIDVDVESYVENGIIYYTVYVTRSGYEELITYDIAFLDECCY